MVHVYLEFEALRCPDSFQLVVAYPAPAELGEAGGGVSFWRLPRLYNSETNSTTFIFEATLPWSWNGEGFPRDNYTLTIFLGANLDFTSQQWGHFWLDSLSSNYECFATFSNIGDKGALLTRIRQITGTNWSSIVVQDAPNSWQEYSIRARHSADFIGYADLAVNLVAIGCVLPLTLPPLMTILAGVLAWRVKKLNVFFDLLLTGLRALTSVYVAMVVFIPVYQLAAQGLKAPLVAVEADALFSQAFIFYAVFLTLALASRVLKRAYRLVKQARSTMSSPPYVDEISE
jgi:hypothetical protein